MASELSRTKAHGSKEEKAKDQAFKAADKFALRNCRPDCADYSTLVKAVRYGVAWAYKHPREFHVHYYENEKKAVANSPRHPPTEKNK